MSRKRTVTTLGVLLVLTFALSSVGRHSTPGEGGLYWVGATAWVCFGIVLLVSLLLALTVGIRRAIPRKAADTTAASSPGSE